MYIFLILWFIFIFAYMIFNIYGVMRVLAMRLKGDVTPLAVLVYLIAIFVVIAISIMLISHLDWGRNLRELLRF